MSAVTTARNPSASGVPDPRPILARRSRVRLNSNAVATSLILALTGLAWGLRLVGAATAGLDGDEAFSAQMAVRPLIELLTYLAGGEPHPPFFYAGLAAWTQVAGTLEIALRYPALAAGVLLVPLAYVAGRLLGDRALGVSAAAIVALNPYQTWYAQEARMYAPAACFGLLAFVAALLALRTHRRRWYVVAAGAWLLAAYTHYYAVFLAAGLAASILVYLLARHRIAEARWWSACLAGAAMLYLPWLLFAWGIIGRHQLAPAGTVDFGGTLLDALQRYLFGQFVGPDLAMPAIVVGLLALAGAVRLARFGRTGPGIGWLLLAAYLLVPIAGGLLLSLVRPMFEVRYFMVAAPALYLFLAAAIWPRSARGVWLTVLGGGLLAVLTAGPLLDHLRHPDRKSDFKSVAVALLDRFGPNDAVVLAGHSQQPQFWYYIRHLGASPVPAHVFPNPERPTNESLETILARHDGVWLLDYDVLAYDPERTTERHLATNHALALSLRPANSRLNYYRSRAGESALAPLDSPVTLRAAGGEAVLELTEVSQPPVSARPGDFVPFDLSWRVVQAPGHDFVISRRILDAERRIVWQRDSEPSEGFAPTHVWQPGDTPRDFAAVAIPDYLPPGDYRLEAIVYPEGGGDPLTTGQGDGGPAIPVGRLTLTDGVAAAESPAPVPLRDGPRQGSVELAGWQMPEGVHAGASFDLPLLWRSRDAGDDDITLVVRTATGETWAEIPVGPPGYGPEHWPAGRRVLQTARITAPVTADQGAVDLRFALRDAAGRESAAVPAGRLAVTARDRDFTGPPDAQTPVARFGDLAELVRASRRAEASPDGVSIDLTWRAAATGERSYHAFVHLVDASGKIIAQSDGPPGGPDAPTTSLLPGEFLTTTMTLPLPPETPPGVYRVLTGLYDPASGQRLPVAGGGDHAAVLEITR